jgi:hypothetical protein
LSSVPSQFSLEVWCSGVWGWGRGRGLPLRKILHLVLPHGKTTAWGQTVPAFVSVGLSLVSEP